MCRIAAYLGDPIPLAEALYRPPHSLEHQSYAPREQLHGKVNVDGTGVAWWDGVDPRPLRYVTPLAPWQDANLPHLAQRLSAPAFLAAVRSASSGMPVGAANVAPFVVGTMAGAHNGFITGFRGALGQELVGSLSAESYGHLHTVNDSLALFVTVLEHYSGDLVQAMADGLATIGDLVRRHDSHATLNLVIADGTNLVAARHSVNEPLNSLYTAERSAGSWVVSEPLDDRDDWRPVPEHHLVHITADGVQLQPLELS